MKNNIFKNKIVKPITNILKQGLSPKYSALSLALGMVIGLSPLFGITTIIVLALSAIFKLNYIISQVGNYVVMPLQIILIIPFCKLGNIVFHVAEISFTAENIQQTFAISFLEGIKIFGIALLEGTMIWIITAIPLFFILFLIFNKMFQYSANKKIKQ